MPVSVPANLAVLVDAHQTWLKILGETKILIEKDAELQRKAAKGLRLKERNVPPEVLGGTYAKYCDLINRMYQSYIGSVQLQRSTYIKDIISVMLRRMFELRNELVNLLVTDYIYVDASLIQQLMTPQDIEIAIPFHLAVEARKDSVEELLQTMWAESMERKHPAPVEMVNASTSALYNRRLSEEVEAAAPPPPVKSEPIIIPEEYIQAVIIQQHERYRQYFMETCKAKLRRRLAILALTHKTTPHPECRQEAAAKLIQKVYRRYMEIKRERLVKHREDVFLGMVPDPFARKGRLDYKEETKKMYMHRRLINERTAEAYMKDLEAQHLRLILMRDVRIDDITEEIREWFKYWYYGYGFLPDYPYVNEGGTILVIRGDYPTVEEQWEEDEKLAAATKGKTKEMLMNEKKQAQLDAIIKAENEKEKRKKEAEAEYKMKCNPLSDRGYKVQQSTHMQSLKEVLQRYYGCWSLYDRLPPDQCGEVIYGYIQTILSEDVICELNVECRRYVDELMRLEWKLLMDSHKAWYKSMGEKYPKRKPRKRPPPPKPPKKPLIVNSELLQGFEYLFDLDIFSKPTSKIDDIMGDSNYTAYDRNVADPNSSFPLPGYGDIRNRLVLSCLYASGIEPNAARNKAVLLVGPAKNGKSFLVDCVAGELNAVKIDVSPEVLSAKLRRPGKALSDVFQAARVFQPCVVYMRNVDRVFAKKVPPEQKHLNARSLKKVLSKYVRGILPEDKVIFIATCSTTSGFKAKPMVSIFDEILLVPRTDYGSLQMFFYNKLQSIRSMPRDYCVQALAHLLQGYGFGAIIETFNRIMSPERIIRLNVTPLKTEEFTKTMEVYEKFTVEDYQVYQDFCINNSSLKNPRLELMDINRRRAGAYEKIAKKKKEQEQKQQ